MLIYANVIMKQLSQGRYQLLRKDDAGKGSFCHRTEMGGTVC